MTPSLFKRIRVRFWFRTFGVLSPTYGPGRPIFSRQPWYYTTINDEKGKLIMASVTEDGQGIRVSLNEAETQLLIDHAQQLKEEGYSNQTIAQRMGITEPSVIVLFEKGNN